MRTTPLRRITRQSSQRGLTEDRTRIRSRAPLVGGGVGSPNTALTPCNFVFRLIPTFLHSVQLIFFVKIDLFPEQIVGWYRLTSHPLMKKLTLSLLAILSLASCATGPNAQTGTVVGALGGAAVGGIIGNQSGRGLEGAAIGAGLGALGGNAIGNAQDQRNAQYYNNQYHNQPQRRPTGYYPNGQPYYGPPAY